MSPNLPCHQIRQPCVGECDQLITASIREIPSRQIRSSDNGTDHAGISHGRGHAMFHGILAQDRFLTKWAKFQADPLLGIADHVWEIEKLVALFG